MGERSVESIMGGKVGEAELLAVMVSILQASDMKSTL